VSGISDDELARLYGESEVAVVPSLYEGFSLPAVEAMACGVPLVATTGGALPEVVGTDGETGLLVAPDDPGAWRSPSGGCSTTRAACPARRGRTPARAAPLHLEGDGEGDRECYEAVLAGRPLPGAPSAIAPGGAD